MRTVMIWVVVGFVHVSTVRAADTTDHLAPLRRMLARESASEIVKVSIYTDEMLQEFARKPTIGEALDPAVRVDLQTLAKNDHVAVVRLALHDPLGDRDLYAFLRKTEAAWKISSIRQLSNIDQARALRNTLRTEETRNATDDQVLRQVELYLASDDSLRSYLRAHAADLERIIDLHRSGRMQQAIKAGRALGIDTMHAKADGRLDMIIAGYAGVVLGIMHVPAGQQPPNMSPDTYFYVEQIRPQYFVFKGFIDPAR
jgi:hypothetical protein